MTQNSLRAVLTRGFRRWERSEVNSFSTIDVYALRGVITLRASSAFGVQLDQTRSAKEKGHPQRWGGRFAWHDGSQRGCLPRYDPAGACGVQTLPWGEFVERGTVARPTTPANVKGPPCWVTLLRKMARLARFERATAWFVARYSIQLSYERAKKVTLYKVLLMPYLPRTS